MKTKLAKFLLWCVEHLMTSSKEPWGSFETSGMDDTGRIPWAMKWNPAFIKQLHQRGFHATTDEESVEMFFIMSHMMPEQLAGQEDTVNPSATPNLTNEANTLRR